MLHRTVGTTTGAPAAGARAPGRWQARARVGLALASVALLAVAAGLGIARSTASAGTSQLVGSGFTVTPGDLKFILKQIKIAEHHAATLTPANPCGTLVGPGPDQIPDALTSYGLRTVDGSCNNLLPGREKFAAADVPFPRLAGSPVFRSAEGAPAGFFGAGSPAIPSSSYAQKKGFVFDSQPRLISNLISDQTSSNPAAVAAALHPVRTQGDPASAVPCTTEPTSTTPGVPAGCTPAHKTLFIPNVTTDVGLSPPFNSWFTFFGQFFDHGVDQTVKSGGTVFIPLHDDDPLVTLGPDGIPNSGDEVPPDQRFMVMTRAQNQPGPDGVLGDNPATPQDESADDVQNANNTDTPWVDQSQTYGSHASHQVFLREYVMNSHNAPVSTGKLLTGLGAGQTYPGSPDMTGGESTWAALKLQAATKLGLLLKDVDVSNIPMLATDPYGKFIPGPHGLPQYVTATGLVEGNLASPVPVPANVLHFDTPFVGDIAHNADPGTVGPCTTPGVPVGCLSPDADTVASHDFAHQPANTYDDELLNAHAACGDGRCNENIALTAVHTMFHSEHDRLVDYIKGVLLNDTSPEGRAALPEWQLPTTENPQGWNGERLFQAARFVTEMEYQHLVFEEFARKMVPAIRPFHVYSPDINPAIPVEFAAATYRFGHSMLTDTISRTNVDPITGAKSSNDISLLDGFLNPPEFYNGGSAGTLPVERAAGAIIMGSVDQTGNEIDEFVTETLRNNLLGLPLDLPSINIARARDNGIPPLNEVRRQIFAKTNDGQLAPYKSWADFGQHLKHPESLINFVAAYGTHPTVTGQTTIAGKRAAARAIVDPQPGDVQPADANDFMFSTGAWANNADGVTRTGLDDVDMWIGGLAEVTNLNGSLLGSTNNYVFQNTLENLQDGDRLYYLARTPGINLRMQLEGNSFAEMIERNTVGTNSLKADVFATADCKFQLANLNGTAAGFAAQGSTVTDDPTTTDCNENLLLQRMPDGTIKYKQFNTVDPSGINGQAVYNGTSGVDRVYGGLDNDTIWGDDGNDVLEGGGGDDVILGGNGNDIETDLDGADTLKGGPGNDAMDAGVGNDFMMGGDGSDFMNGGANDNEEFAGPGNDFIMAGSGADAPFGGGGDDWMEFGLGQDIGAGDHEAPFFDDPGEYFPGNDVMIGQPGENDYDAEGGDDIMAMNPAIERNAGAGGFDFAINQYNTVPANDDMMINNNLGGLPIQVIVNRDRWQETESDSGSSFNDVIKGTDGVLSNPRLIGGAGFQGCDAIDQAGLARIKGLSALLPPVANWLGNATDVAALSASGYCPLRGPVWGEGDILLGGAGSDTFTGRSGDDIIDGDRELRVRISVRTDPANPATEIGTTDLLENQYLHDAAGNPTGPTLQDAIMSGQIDPGNLVIVREILDPAGPADVDTADYAGPRSQYTIVRNANGSITVADTTSAPPAPGVVATGDGTDTLWNIEQLQFADQLVTVASATAPAVTTTPTAATGLTLPNTTVNTTSASSNVTVRNSGTGPLLVTGLSLGGTNPGDFTITGTTCLAASVAAGGTCTVSVAFKPTATGARSATLLIADNAAGSPQSIPLRGTGLAPVTTAAFIFGNQTVEAKLDSNAGGLAEAFKTTTASSGTVTQLRVYVDTGSTGALTAGLYTNSATNHPGALLTQGTLAAPVTGQFNTITVPSANVTSGSTYWIAVLGTGGTFRFRDRAGVGAGSSETSSVSTLTALPNAWTTGATFSDGAISGYAAGTITATPPPPPPPPGLAVLVGNANTEATVDTNTAGRAEAFKTTAATTGSVQQLRIFLDATSTAGNVVVGLYNNSATNHPGTLLTTGTITTPVANAQNNVTVPPAAVTAGQTYWIAVLQPTGVTGTIKFRNRANVGAGNSETSSLGTLTGLPNTWTTGTAFADGLLSAVGLG
jgi:Ca2+-binding RTX toxin-like protein